MLNNYVEYKDCVLAEVIFLTHNESKHMNNMENHPETEKHLWVPHLQEAKTSQYGGKNYRYKLGLKKNYINQFIALHDSIIPWNTIRYIF
jgi:spore photoproduct lyase